MEQRKKCIAYFDFICPWCYISSVRVKRLAEEFSIEMEWRSFQLNPRIPREGMTPETYFGSLERFDQSFRYVQSAAAEEALVINRIPLLPNSMVALEVGEVAKDRNRFHIFQPKVFEAYFRDGKNIGEPELVLGLAEESGLDRNETRTFLEGGSMNARIEQDRRTAQRLLVTGVPTFFLGVHRIVGAQPYEVFQKAAQNTMKKG